MSNNIYAQRRQTLAANKKRRQDNYTIKTFSLKVQKNHLSQYQIDCLSQIFDQAKTYYNSCIHFMNTTHQGAQYYNYSLNSVVDPVTNQCVNLNLLSVATKQTIIRRISASVKTIRTQLSKHCISHSSGLRFVRNLNFIIYRQYKFDWRFHKKKLNYIRISKINKPFKVQGSKQLLIEGIEFTSLSLVKKGVDFYFNIVCYVPKVQHNDIISAVDFGITTTFTVAHYDHNNFVYKSFKCCVDRKQIIKLQQKLKRKQKYSRRFKKIKAAIYKQRLKLCYRKQSFVNKLLFELKYSKTIIIQDDPLFEWQNSGLKSFLHHSVLGLAKRRLKQMTNVVWLSRWIPTSKYCFECNTNHKNLSIHDRIFVCPVCGYTQDRDQHAAKNMILYFLYK